MCQISKSRKFIKTKEDIIVYKHLNFYNGVYISPYRNKKYKLGKTYRASMFWIKLKISKDKSSNYHVIYYGLHSYVEIPTKSWSYIIGEFIIPKGSYVNYGMFVDDSSIVSNKLIFNKIALCLRY